MHNLLKNKKILITAGPTWVPIDKVRVISNVSSGATGIAVAEYAAKNGGRVTLLLGPVGMVAGRWSLVAGLKIIRFKYFDELQNLIRSQLKRKKYDIIVHIAAVSDYRPAGFFSGKIGSGSKGLTIKLRPTPKIIDDIRKYAPGAFLVMFKLEAGKTRRRFAEIAYKSMLRAGADLVVANNIGEVGADKHKAYIIDSRKRITGVKTKSELAKQLFSVILQEIQ